MTDQDPTAASELGRHFCQSLAQADPQIATAISGELERQRDQIELIASENLVSRAVLQAQGSILTNKTVEGYPGKRYYGGAQFADAVEALAIERACALFGCQFANVQPHSGSNANQAVYLAVLSAGATILSMDIAAGGHISHGHKATLTGRTYNIVSYGLHSHNQLINYEQAEQLALEHRPELIIAGGSAYSRVIDFERLANTARKVGGRLLVDMAHFAGLVATGHYPNPFPHADIVTTTTYKSLRGARGGMALWNDAALSSKINNAVFPGVQGSVMLHAVAAKAVCLGEAMQTSFAQYNAGVIANAQAMAASLSASGVVVVSGGTDTGLMLVDVRSMHTTGAQAVELLEAAGLTCNKNLIPFDPLPAEVASGLRLSVNAGTARGFTRDEFFQIGTWIADVLKAAGSGTDPAPVLENIRHQVSALCGRFPIYHD